MGVGVWGGGGGRQGGGRRASPPVPLERQMPASLQGAGSIVHGALFQLLARFVVVGLVVGLGATQFAVVRELHS